MTSIETDISVFINFFVNTFPRLKKMLIRKVRIKLTETNMKVYCNISNES